jgi:hypothetical protein
MRPGNLDGVLKKGTQHSAAHVELVFVPIIGFLSHSYIFTKIALHFGMVMVNTLLNSGKIKVNCKHRRTLVCPIQVSEPRSWTCWPELCHLVPPVCRHIAYFVFQVETFWKMCLLLLWLVKQRKRVICPWLTNPSLGTLCNHHWLGFIKLSLGTRRLHREMLKKSRLRVKS